MGLNEDDPIRKDDSFITFEEILAHAVRTKADALLLGGDIFHDNKPSRPTIVRTLELLRKYCMNDNPVNIQVLSDQAGNFSRCAGSAALCRQSHNRARSNTRVNYEDENYNIGLPVFIIHGARWVGGHRCGLTRARRAPCAGNHDEPAGTDNLSAIDILAAANLVNYYGKLVRGGGAGRFGALTPGSPPGAAQSMSGQGAGKVCISPVLLQKARLRRRGAARRARAGKAWR